jgi:predicted nucleic acid-binding protein
VFLLDTSVINRLDASSVAEALLSLASQGTLFTKQRGRKPGDLLIAAIALRTGFSVIHYDHDYDTIASLTPAKQLKTAWVVAAGSIS